MYRTLQTCRACGLGEPTIPTLKQSTAAGQAYAEEQKLIPVFDLGVQPLANDFVEKGGTHKGFAPLKVLFCPRCTLAQLSVAVDPQVLYRDYLYVTSPSRTMQEHFAKLRKLIGEEQSATSVLEIGSNDGALLRFMEKNGASRILGIDPARNLSNLASKEHIPTINAVWDRDAAEDAAAHFETGVDIILARHVFCHVDNWKDFLHNLAVPSKKDTLVCIEVPYVQDLLEGCEFDTIYHEHTSYLSIQSFRAALNGSPWRLHRVERLEIHGGALLLMLRRTDYEGKAQESVRKALESESITLERWREFAVKAHRKIGELSAFVRNLVTSGQEVVGYGASAKSTVWINACSFTRSQLRFITDTTLLKQYRFSPGSDIPIVDEGALTRELPKYAVCFAWNFFPEIYEKEKIFREKGGKWILPHPEIKVV